MLISHFYQLSLTASSQKEPVLLAAHKRLNLLRKLEMQIKAAEAELWNDEFLEGIRKWVRGEDNERELITEQRPVRKWRWWRHTGTWMLTLRDNAKEFSLGDGKASIEISESSNLVDVLRTIRFAIPAGN